MTKVHLYELTRPKSLEKIEKAINEELRTHVDHPPVVRLLQTADGQIGYSTQIIPSKGGRKVLELIHQLVCRAAGYKRGRPPAAAPTHQVKCRVPDRVYQKLIRQAAKRHVTPSRLAGEFVTRQVERAS